MSTDKLTKSLDQIMTDRKPAGSRQVRRRGARSAAARAKAAISAPTGGVQKNTKHAKPTGKATGKVSANARLRNESKIIVSNLPADVSENDVKDLFIKAFGSVKKAIISYGPNGRSRGEAHVTFGKSHFATEAVTQFNGIHIDGREIKVEVVGIPAETAAPAPKGLSDRMSKPKNATKGNPVAGAKKATVNDAAKAKGGKENKKKSGRAGRPKPKTAEELDAEMQDYFGGNENANNAGAAAPVNGVVAAVGGDTGMTDEVL